MEPKVFAERERESGEGKVRETQKKVYPAVYRVAIFLEANLALSALSSESLLRTKPSPLHSGHIPEPPQASQIFIGTCTSEK